MSEGFIHFLPTLNAMLNAISGVLLILAYVAVVVKRKPELHKKLMVSALVVSALFLVSYTIYHNEVGSVVYPLKDWLRTLYLAILFPHMILATLMVPFIIAAVIYALRGRYREHVRITKRLWPVWMFVSVSGVIVYYMLYIYAGAKPV